MFFAVLSARSKLFTTPAQMPPLHCHAIFATYPDSQSNSNQKGPFGEHIRCWHQGWMSHLDTMKTIDQIYYGGRDLVWLKPGSTLVSLTGSRCCPKGTSYKRLEKLRHAERGKNLERSELHSFHRWRVQPVWPKVSAEPVASVAKDCHSASPSRNENNLFLSRHKTCLLDPQNQIWFQVLIPVRFSMS